MTSPFIGNNNTVLNLIAENTGTNITTAPYYSYGAIDNIMQQNPITAMTSNSSGGYTASSSGSSTGSPFNLFDGANTAWSSLIAYNTTTGAYSGGTFTATNLGNVSGEWIQLDAPSAFICNAVSFCTNSVTQCVGNWALCAANSNAPVTWQVIHTEVNCATIFDGVFFQSFGLNPAFNTPYSSYRVIFQKIGPPTLGTGRDRINLREIQFYGYPPNRTNSGTWKLRPSADIWFGDFGAIFRQPIASQQPTLNTVVVRPLYLNFSRTAQQSMLSDNNVPFLINSRGGFTAVAYVRFNSSALDPNANNECIFDFAKDVLPSGGSNASIVLRRSGTTSNLEFYIESVTSGAVVVQVIGGTITPGQWTMIAVRYTVSTSILQLYQDQVLVASVDYSTPLPPPVISDRVVSSLYIGRSNNLLDTITFDGSIGGLVVYDKSLSDTEINNLYITIYGQNQSIITPNIADYTTQTIRVLLLAISVNGILTGSRRYYMYYKNKWISVGRRFGGNIAFAYSDDGITWTPAKSSEFTVPPSSDFGIVYNTLANGSGSGGTATVPVPPGNWTFFALRDYINYVFSTLSSPANGISISVGTTGRFSATITDATYFIGTGGTLTGITNGFGFNTMYTGSPPTQLQTYTRPVDAPRLIPNLIFNTSGHYVETNGSIWVASGTGSGIINTLAYSTDGINWTGLSNTIFSTAGFGMAWNGTRWVVGGQGAANSLATSTDGINWTGLGTTIFGTSCEKVAWNGTRWVAVGSGTNSIAWSNDGTTWTGLGTTIFTNSNYVAWNGKLWVAVGQGATNIVATSTDGITWTGRGRPGTTLTGLQVCWNGSYWMMTAQNNNAGNNLFFISQDGITWTGYTGMSLGNQSLRGIASRFTVL